MSRSNYEFLATFKILLRCLDGPTETFRVVLNDANTVEVFAEARELVNSSLGSFQHLGRATLGRSIGYRERASEVASNPRQTGTTCAQHWSSIFASSGHAEAMKVMISPSPGCSVNQGLKVGIQLYSTDNSCTELHVSQLENFHLEPSLVSRREATSKNISRTPFFCRSTSPWSHGGRRPTPCATR